jgi:hypothetical protein
MGLCEVCHLCTLCQANSEDGRGRPQQDVDRTGLALRTAGLRKTQSEELRLCLYHLVRVSRSCFQQNQGQTFLNR